MLLNAVIRMSHDHRRNVSGVYCLNFACAAKRGSGGCRARRRRPARRHPDPRAAGPGEARGAFFRCLSSAAGAVGGVATLITLEGGGRADSEQCEAENQQRDDFLHGALLGFSSRCSCTPRCTAAERSSSRLLYRLLRALKPRLPAQSSCSCCSPMADADVRVCQHCRQGKTSGDGRVCRGSQRVRRGEGRRCAILDSQGAII